MSFTLLLLVFLLGCLIGLLWVQIRWQRTQEKQREIQRQYEALIWKQLEQFQQLLQTNNDLLADNAQLRQNYRKLQIRHEKMLAELN